MPPETEPMTAAPNPPTTETDVAVVGAGPIGLELAVALKRAGVDYLQFDARQVGYTMSWWAPQTKWFSSNDRIAIAGVPLQTWDQGKATREEYLAYLRRVVIEFDLAVRTYEPVTGIEKLDDGRFQVTTRPGGRESGQTATTLARHVVLATGGTDYPRRLGIPGEDLPHVSHYFKDPHTYFRKRLLIVGGRNSAVEAALRCHVAGARVSVSYRGHSVDNNGIKYWLLPEYNGLVSAGSIAGLYDTVPTAITPSHVTLASTVGGPSQEVPFDFVLLLVGYHADATLLRNAGIELDGASNLPRYDPKTMETNVPGLYVAGCAVGGTQEKYQIFLENCHVHVPRIVAAVQGRTADVATPEFARPES
jgi:thioredoxin reductase (NADPH)